MNDNKKAFNFLIGKLNVFVGQEMRVSSLALELFDLFGMSQNKLNSWLELLEQDGYIQYKMTNDKYSIRDMNIFRILKEYDQKSDLNAKQ